VPHRPLVLVTGLTVGDYLLWNWSLNGNYGVLALIAGVTLPPLAVMCVWLLALSAARLLARSARRPAGGAKRRVGNAARRSHARAAHDPHGLPPEEPPTSTAPAGSPSRKLAA
jgi:hypothetical protein